METDVQPRITNDRGKKRLENDNNHLHEPPPRAKRIRVSQACNECRKKKERCDGVQPQCGPCSSLNRSCCFDAQPRRRGLPTGYVRAMEVVLGLIFHSIDGIEHCATAILRGERRLPACHMERASLVNSLTDSWRRSRTMQELERLLAGIDSVNESELSTRELYEKLEGAFMERLIVDDDYNTRIQLLSPPRTNTPPAFEQLAPDLALENSTAILPLVASIAPFDRLLENCHEPMNLPHDWSHLLDRYFTDTHAWFPIAPKHDVLRQAFSLANIDSEPEGHECVFSNGDRAALFATLAYACYRETLSVHDRPEHVEGSSAPSEEVQQESPSMSLTRRLQNEATSILAQGNERVEHDAGHVQALLVLTILQIDQGFITQAWLTIGQAVHIAIILNIIRASQPNTESVVDDKQRRLFLGMYILETLIAYTLDRRPYLQRSDLAKIGPLPVDSIEEWEAWRPLDVLGSTTVRQTRTPGRSLSTFNAFLNLVTLLNDQAHGVSSVEETLKGFQSWRITQPSARQNVFGCLEAANPDTPPQMLNLALATLSLDAILQIKSVLAHDNSASPASLLPIPALAHQSLEAIMRYRRLVIPSQACPLMAIYISMIGSQVNVHGRPYAINGLQHLPVPIDRLTRRTNNEKSSDNLQLQTPASCTISAQPAVPYAASGNSQTFEAPRDHAHDNYVLDKSLFDSLSFLDTTDCSHQSGRFLENLGISSDVSSFNIETLFA